ncbi:MAG: hypothetical protein JSS27_19200 [Planctomycetes bacterium]|nr:hypothetical protein [Planctomycetota bacterium]
MSNLAIVVGESTGRWALACHRALATVPRAAWPDEAPPRVHEARHADDFFAQLTPLDAAIGVWEFHERNFDVLGRWRREARPGRTFRALVAVGPAWLVSHQAELCELGVTAVVVHERELLTLADWVARAAQRVSHLPQAKLSLRDHVWRRLPWGEAV